MKIILIQCELGIESKELEQLWKTLYNMGKAGIIVLPEYCKFIGAVEVDKINESKTNK